MFKMSAFSVDTDRQTTPLANGMVHNRLVQFAPHGDQMLAQLIDVLVINACLVLYIFPGFSTAKNIEIG